MARVSPGFSNCWVKQKHSVLLKNSVACFGAMLGTACPTSACALRLVAVNQASLISPGCTRIEPALGAKLQARPELTVPSNSTVTQREASTVIAPILASLAATLATLEPNTFSQAMR